MPYRVALAALLLFASLPAQPPAQGGDFAPLRGAPGAAPELAGETLDGTPWRLAQHRGEVVLVGFWAGWCSPCLEEMPALERLALRMQGRPFALVGVNAGEPALRARTLAGQLKLGFPVLTDPESAAFLRWGASILPTAYLIDGEGRLRLAAEGPVDWDDPHVLRTIEGLLAELPETGLGLGLDARSGLAKPNRPQSSP